MISLDTLPDATCKLASLIVVDRKADKYFPAKRKKPLELRYGSEREPPFCYEAVGS